MSDSLTSGEKRMIGQDGEKDTQLNTNTEFSSIWSSTPHWTLDQVFSGDFVSPVRWVISWPGSKVCVSSRCISVRASDKERSRTANDCKPDIKKPGWELTVHRFGYSSNDSRGRILMLEVWGRLWNMERAWSWLWLRVKLDVKLVSIANQKSLVRGRAISIRSK
jgi:hypothetical protein